MEILFAAAIVGIILMSCIAFYIGKKMGNQGENTERVLAMDIFTRLKFLVFDKNIYICRIYIN